MIPEEKTKHEFKFDCGYTINIIELDDGQMVVEEGELDMFIRSLEGGRIALGYHDVERLKGLLKMLKMDGEGIN